MYPDLEEPPRALTTDYHRADYVARICGAWDYGIFPTPGTFALFAGWRDIFDRFPVLTSSAYAAFSYVVSVAAHAWREACSTPITSEWRSRARRPRRIFGECLQVMERICRESPKTPEEIEANAFASIRLEGGYVADEDRELILTLTNSEASLPQIRCARFLPRNVFCRRQSPASERVRDAGFVSFIGPCQGFFIFSISGFSFGGRLLCGD